MKFGSPPSTGPRDIGLTLDSDGTTVSAVSPLESYLPLNSLLRASTDSPVMLATITKMSFSVT